MLFCSCGEMFSRLPGKVFRCDVVNIKEKQIENTKQEILRKLGKFEIVVP